MVCETNYQHHYKKTKHCPVLYVIKLICEDMLLYFSQMSTLMLREIKALTHATNNEQYRLNLMERLSSLHNYAVGSKQAIWWGD